VNPPSATFAAFALAGAVLLGGCPSGDVVEPPAAYVPRIPTLDAGARSGLHRLTADEWRNSAEALLGVRWEGDLPADFELHGYTSVGSAEVTVAPLDFELYETAAWGVAAQAVPDGVSRDALLGCTAAPMQGLEDQFTGSEQCLRTFAVGLLAEAWRRPVSGEEAGALVDLYATVEEATGRSILAVQAMVAAALVAPDFLFRVELGEEHESDPGRRWLNDHEMAARLSLGLLDQPPRDVLAALADADGLGTAEAVEAAAATAWADPSAPAASTRFFSEWMDLDRLALTSKDPELFPAWNEELQGGLSAEVQWLFEELAVSGDGDLRQMLTTTRARITPEVAALYGVAPPDDAGTPVDLPPERAGLLTRGAFLATNAHASLTSPTLRGKFVRSRLLCQDIPPPPDGVVASLDGVDDSGTLRQQLEQHMEDAACRPCHSQMDPIGFAFEHYDATGAWREEDRGFPVDSSGELDGSDVAGGAELGAVLAEHPRLPGCITINAWSHLLGHIEQFDEEDSIDAVADGFAADGHRLSQLTQSVASTIEFRTLRTPEGGICAESEEGARRACSTDCGDGLELCTGGFWTECTADFPERESCNGVDDDCDGQIDEDVVRACDAGGVPGLQSCLSESWSGCLVPGGPETCNGVDDDGDGVVDEGLNVDFRSITSAELATHHEACTPETTSSWTDACRAAVHRACSTNGCATSGIGPVAVGGGGGFGTIACFAPEEAIVHTVTFADLAAEHGYCTPGTAFSPDCNASINRWCANQGEVTGYGPVEHNTEIAVIHCNPLATKYFTTFTEVSAHHPTCDGTAQRWGEECDEAYHRFCRGHGHLTGHGPLEHSGDDVQVACVGSLE